jgi:glycosyltransferase involved in cell wall biosynthesis
MYFLKLMKAGKDVDVLLALDPVSTGFPTMLAAFFLKKPFVLKVVGDYAWEQGVQRFGVRESLDEFSQGEPRSLSVGFLKDVECFVARRAKKIIVPSIYLRSIVVGWGVPLERIEVIYNAVSVGHVGLVPLAVKTLRRPCIVSIGRLVPWKGMSGLIDAVNTARNTSALSLVIVGDGPEHVALAALSGAVLKDGYTLTGELSHADTLAMLQYADAFVLNTSYEGLSHLLIEALSLGVPIITTSVGGNPELIEDGKNGLMVPVEDSAALVAAMLRMTSDDVLRSQLSLNAKESSKRFSVDTLAASTATLLASCV